jgi:methanogenic corrinoid protein MtbC1
MNLSELQKRYLRAQLSGDRREAMRLIVEEGTSRGISVSVLASEVIRASQSEIGRLWEENRISIAEEHMATAISQVALAYLYQQAATPAPIGKKIIVSCVEGELHDFPARLVADALDLEGYAVRFLGASVPVDSLVSVLGQDGPDMLALSVTMSFNVGALRNTVKRVRQEFPSLPIAVGGHACAWSATIVRELAAEATGSDAAEMIAAAKKVFGDNGA